MRPFSSSYIKVVDSKREQRAKAVATANSEAKEQTSFTNATASEIVSRIQNGEWTATQVIEAYIQRAAFAHATTNCLTEVMFEWGRGQAKELDEEFSRTKKLRGPLHGVPISVKDLFNITGVDSCIGYSQWANKPASANGDIITLLLDAGAVIFVKTNVPQTMFAFECSNPVWGRTVNPYNDMYTCGGSSGGEGALLAMDGSAIGIGSDIGGSLRIPAAYCGIYSLKSSTGRMSSLGGVSPVPGFEGFKTVIGPMGRCVEDLELICRLTFGVQCSDQNVVPIPYREARLSEKLRFGYYTSDDFVKTSPACKRAVLETVEALREQGHECVEFQLPSAVDAIRIFVAITSADGYRKMLSHIGPDPREKSLFLVALGPKLSSILRKFSVWIIKTFLHDPVFASLFKAIKNKSVEKYHQLVAERNEFTRSFNKEVWEKYNFDGIIAPAQALPQLPHGGCESFSAIAVATAYYNLLDQPAGCIPVTRVDPKLDALTDEWTNPTEGKEHGSPIFEAGLYKGPKALYKPEELKGMPVGVQVVGRKWEEEKVLAMMRVVEGALTQAHEKGKERTFGPGAWDAWKAAAK